MQTPLEIDFQGISADPAVRSVISEHVHELESRFGRITACRVVLKAPGSRHQTGGLYEINIRIVLPDGREVNVARTPTEDERHSDLNFAVNDAFKRARRLLQDKVRVMRGDVKQREAQPVGTVLSLDPLGEFGFIDSGDGREIYFHRNSVLNGGFSELTVGSRVSFAEEVGDKGPQASTVKLLSKHTLRT